LHCLEECQGGTYGIDPVYRYGDELHSRRKERSARVGCLALETIHGLLNNQWCPGENSDVAGAALSTRPKEGFLHQELAFQNADLNTGCDQPYGGSQPVLGQLSPDTNDSITDDTRTHWAFGMGTGDTQRTFVAQYERTDSTLLPPWRCRTNKQHPTLWTSFGVRIRLWSLSTCWWPAWKLGAWPAPLFIAWAIIFGISCLTDDTIETRAGATFLALYYALLVFAAPRTGTLTEVPPADRAPVPA